MISKLQIAQWAVSHIGQSVLNSFTDDSEAARATESFIDAAIASSLAQRIWGFATKDSVLALVEDNDKRPMRYLYAYPKGCARLWKVLPPDIEPNTITKYPFSMESIGQGKVIRTSVKDARAVYVSLDVDPIHFKFEFAMGVSFLLAIMCAPQIGRGSDKINYKRLRDNYSYFMAEAGAIDANENETESVETAYDFRNS